MHVDMCIGTRYLDKRSSEFQSTAIRRLGSKIISIFIKIFAGKKITDPTSGFRAVNKKIIEERKKIFVDYNGSFDFYINHGGKQIPLLIIAINNVEAFLASVL